MAHAGTWAVRLECGGPRVVDGVRNDVDAVICTTEIAEEADFLTGKIYGAGDFRRRVAVYGVGGVGLRTVTEEYQPLEGIGGTSRGR